MLWRHDILCTRVVRGQCPRCSRPGPHCSWSPGPVPWDLRVATHWAMGSVQTALVAPNYDIGVHNIRRTALLRVLWLPIYIDIHHVTIGEVHTADCRTLTQRMLLVTGLGSQIITWPQSSARHTAITRLLAADIVASAVNDLIGEVVQCTITEKAPIRAFPWLKAPTSAFTFKTLLRHYAKQTQKQCR